MSEPLKPRIDFDGPLEAEKMEALKSARAFDGAEAAKFAPARVDALEEDEGAAEAVVESVLRPKRSLWRRMVSAGLAIFGVSIVAQGVQWTLTAWQTQDWIALGGCAAGALIVGAGVGSVATEWRRLWRLRQRAHERDEARDCKRLMPSKQPWLPLRRCSKSIRSLKRIRNSWLLLKKVRGRP